MRTRNFAFETNWPLALNFSRNFRTRYTYQSLIYYLPISILPAECVWHKIFSPKVWNKAYSKSLLVQTSDLKLFFLIIFRNLGVRDNVQLKEGLKTFWKIFCGIWTQPYFRFKYFRTSNSSLYCLVHNGFKSFLLEHSYFNISKHLQEIFFKHS